MDEIVKLTIGQIIEVCGHRFVLTEITASYDKPARVIFKQPFELTLKESVEGIPSDI